MSFSSSAFLFGFLPLFLAGYFAAPERHRNLFLLLASLAFYALLSGLLAWVLLFAVAWNYALARALTRSDRRRKVLLFAGLSVDLALLGWFKYASFSWSLSRPLLTELGIPWEELAPIVLPAGLSFIVFSAASYLIDLYRRDAEAPGGLVEFATWLCSFPKLVAGPITRYGEMVQALRQRTVGADGFFDGVCRFAIGLGKKVVIADNVGLVVAEIHGFPEGHLTSGFAWLAAVSYTIQIYFDFSGYTDMAIGIGRMLGFGLPENFDRPYRAASVTEFWRRWHMTLTRWFRDYLYIPLGGNRKGPLRTYANLLAVFLLCGLWHGAGLTFVVWGAYHGLFLTLERVASNRFGLRPAGLPGLAYTLLVVTIGWVLFRADSLHAAAGMLEAMLGLGGTGEALYPIGYVLTPDRALYLVLGLLFCLLPWEHLWQGWSPARLDAARGASAIAVFVLAIVQASVQSFSPFIYFRF